MCEMAKNNVRFHTTSSTKLDICNFPLEIDLGTPSESFLRDVFNKYYKLLEDFDFDKDLIDVSKIIGDGIIKTISIYKTGDLYDAYMNFEGIFDNLSGKEFYIRSLERDEIFYRMRKEKDKIEEKEFYCLNSELRHLSSACRYSIAGYPCFYVGYSINDCRIEISESGSICKLQIKVNNNGEELRVLDITFNQIKEFEESYVKIWPLIAACNMNYIDGREVNFKEEYIIPQFFTMYVLRKRRELNVDGICYYSTRNRKLNIYGRGEEDYRNIVLFPLGESNDDVYGLMKLFDFSRGENISNQI